MNEFTPGGEYHPKPVKTMEGSYKSQGSKPYLVVAEKDGMQLGVKFVFAIAPIIVVGLRLRVEWAAGHSDIETAKEKFGIPFVEGSTPTNGSFSYMLPLLKRPAYGDHVKQQFTDVQGAECLVGYLFSRLSHIGIEPTISATDLLLHISSGFDDAFPDIKPQPLEAVVIPGDQFAEYLQKMFAPK